MKKLVIFIVIIFLVVLIGTNVLKSTFNVETEKSALPTTVYEYDGDLVLLTQQYLIEIANPTTTEDDKYSLTEQFLNVMLLDSIQTNLNEEYNPLSDCETDSCQYIASDNKGYIEYAFIELNEDNQAVLTISLGRNQYPDIETAIYMIFDVDISLVEMSMILTLDQMYINETEIKKDHLDRLFNYLNKNDIEAMITEGTLDLGEYTYTVPLITE
ncbi:MAG: hypothetical protein K9L74_03230 [Candidatus Izimaplasma sp.]|nr:hypothetical protein [Candidatus Izimaplasma bacterium]